LLVSQYEAINTYQYDNKYFVILPSVPTGRSYEEYQKLKKIEEPFFSSKNTVQLTVEEFQSMVRDDGRVSKTMPSEIELQQLSKDEILNYFKNQGWVK
jgi:ribosome assembly protein YihI (activator of Der GTPase)